MATGSKKLAPAASRSWLKYGAIGMAILIGSVLTYRNLAGTTIKEQKAASAKEKEARDLGNKTPGNAEAFSTRLESKRKENEEAAALERGKTLAPDAGLGTKIIDSSKTAAAEAMPKGKPPTETPTDAQLDAYANLKEEQQLAQNRKLSFWEAQAPNSALGALGQAGGLEQLLGQLSGAQVTSTVAKPASAPDSASLMNAYLKSQGQAAPTATKDAQFVKGLETKGIASPLYVQASPGRNTLIEGAEIPIVMQTAVSSDLPGPCRAKVEYDVFDSITQSIKLIPAASTVLCTYNSETVAGQDRLMLAFTRLIFPNGTSVALGGMEGGDEQGKIGAKAEVNTRFWSRFGSSLMIAGISTLTQGILPIGSGTTINMPGSSSSGAGTQALGEVAKKSFERNLNIKEELSLSPGDRLRVIVTRDMVLDPAITQVRR